MTEPSTTCPGCDQPVDLTERHVTLLRQTETTRDGVTTVAGEVTVIEYRHPACDQPETVQADQVGGRS